MSNQQEHLKNPKFDLLQSMRKPHGIAFAAILLGLAGWAVWTFWVW